MSPARKRKKRSCPRSWTSSSAHRTIPRWARASPRACCSSALRAPARRSWPARSRARQACSFCPFRARTLSSSMSASAHRVCAICSTRPRRSPRPSCSSMRSTRSAASAAAVSAAVTTSASRRSTSCSSRWTALRITRASSSWRRPTAPTFSITRCCAPAALTGACIWVCPISRAARRS